MLPLLLVFAASLTGCVSDRYERAGVLAGQAITETLLISGELFRLERSSGRGQEIFEGALEVSGEEWRFSLESRRTTAGVRRLSPAVVFVYRGRAFDNGIAFYALLSPRSPPADIVFIRAPCDFDVVR